MDIDKLIKQISAGVKENKDYMPLVGALLGFLIAGDKETKEKITNGLIGAGLGYLVKDSMKKIEEENN